MDPARAAAVADASMRRFVSLLPAVPDPYVKVPGGWSIRDVAAHVAGAVEAYGAILRGEGSPVPRLEDVATFNARSIASVEEQDLRELAARIEGAFESAIAWRDAGDGTDPVAWHGGLRVPLATAWSALAGEALVHGYDVARAAKRPWPMPEDDVRTTLLGLLPLLPHYLDSAEAAGVRACVDLRLRGDRDARAFLVFDDGRLQVEEPNGRGVDCHISADPAAYMLVAYGRMAPLRPALAGRIVAWGRRPQLAFRLSRLFRTP